MNNTQIKRLARIRLEGNWGNCTALSMLMFSFVLMVILGEMIIYYIVSDAYGFSSYRSYISSGQGLALLAVRLCAYFLLFVPELSNIRSIYISLACGKSFSGTQWELRHNSIKYYLKISATQVLSLIYQALLAVPLAVCIFAVIYYTDLCRSEMSTKNLLMFMLCLLISIMMLCVFLYFRIKLRLLPYIMVIRSDIGIIDAFILSARLMKKNVIRYVFFQLSFLHYFAACLLVFPILAVVPYYYMSVTVFCTSLVSRTAVDEYIKGKDA